MEGNPVSMIRILFFVLPLAIMAAAGNAQADDKATAHDTVELQARTQVRFASVAEGRSVVARADRFVRSLSPWDRQARLQTDRDVSTEEFLQFVAGEVLAWDPEARRKVDGALAKVRERLRTWALPLPAEILFVLTTGREEGGAAYCREQTIVLPKPVVSRRSEAALEQLLLHELFHLVSTHDPALRERLYALLGFHRTGEVTLPAELAARRITNPDAPVVEHGIDLEFEGRTLTVMPLIYSDMPRYPAGDQRPFFSFLQFRLLVVRREPGGGVVPELRDGAPVLLDPASVPAYHEKIGRNTGYIIHPEEVLADNFALLLLGRTGVKSPQLLEGLGRLLPVAGGGRAPD